MFLLKRMGLQIAKRESSSRFISLVTRYFFFDSSFNQFYLLQLCRGLYKNFVEAGKVKNVGHTAINTLRIEAGLPEFGTDFGAPTSPMEIKRLSFPKVCLVYHNVGFPG